LFFAFGHSLVNPQWWHFATFFPGLVFAWMRERSGGVTAGAFFHAICNIGVFCLDTQYGIR
jgi:membrane protease YdiL (CAAX protease family)